MKITQIVLELLTKCNFSCPYCRDDSGSHPIMSLAKSKEIIDNFSKIGVKKVQLDGGEPFLYEDIFELMDYIESKGLEPGIYTNASLITEKTAQKLSNYKAIKLAVTLHPLNPEKNIRATYEGLKNLKYFNIYPNLIMVVTNDNYELLPGILENVSTGNYTLTLNPLVSSGKAYDKDLKPIDTAGKESLKKITEKALSQHSAVKIIDNATININNLEIEKIQMNSDEEFALHINTDGEILPFFSADPETSIGNVNDFDEVLQTLASPDTLKFLSSSKIAMKKRIYGIEKGEHRKILRKDILGGSI